MLRKSFPGGIGRLEDGEDTEPLVSHSNHHQQPAHAQCLFADDPSYINGTAAAAPIEGSEEGQDDHVVSVDGVIGSPTPPPAPPLLVVTSIVYGRRWWILLLFSLMSFAQNVIWNTWSPLDKSVAVAFNWTTADVALQTNWGCITFVIFAPVFTWIMDVKGLRVSCLLTGFLLLLGSGLRCISSDPKTATWLIHCGQFLNGMAGPVTTAGSPLLSSVWFPADQRTIATSLALLAAGFGVATSYIIGPLMVPNPETHHHTNWSEYSNVSLEENDKNPAITTAHFILRLMYIECAFAGVVFVALLIYFPAKPPTPPSVSANTTRLSYKTGFKALVRNRDFWKVALCFGMTMGIADQWSSILDVDVTDLVQSEMELGWVGFASNIACGIGGFLFSWFSDRYMKHVKLILLSVFSTSLCLCLIFGLICSKIIPFNKSVMYSLYVLTVVGIEGSSPLFYELGCETAYPTSEGLANGLLTWLDNCVGLVFLLLLMIPGIGLRWMNWVMAGGIAISIPLLLFYRENYNRLDVDVTINQSPDDVTINQSPDDVTINQSPDDVSDSRNDDEKQTDEDDDDDAKDGRCDVSQQLSCNRDTIG